MSKTYTIKPLSQKVEHGYIAYVSELESTDSRLSTWHEAVEDLPKYINYIMETAHIEETVTIKICSVSDTVSNIEF